MSNARQAYQAGVLTYSATSTALNISHQGLKEDLFFQFNSGRLGDSYQAVANAIIAFRSVNRQRTIYFSPSDVSSLDKEFINYYGKICNSYQACL